MACSKHIVNICQRCESLSSLNSDAGAGTVLEIVSAETGASQMTTSRRCSRHTMARCLSRGAHLSGGFTFCALCVLCVLFRRFVPFDFLLNAVSVSRPWSRDVMSWAWRVRQLIFNGEVGPWVNFHSRPFQPILFGFYRFLYVFQKHTLFIQVICGKGMLDTWDSQVSFFFRTRARFGQNHTSSGMLQMCPLV